MIPFKWFNQARERITPYISQTPLSFDENLNLYLKWENQQITGSFKARGAFNRVLTLENWELQNGLIAASAGNHGQGVALAGKQAGSSVTIYIPDNAPQIKIDAIKGYGAEVVLIPGGYANAEKAALSKANEMNATWISPYNDGQVIAGQGTIGLEVIHQIQETGKKLEDATWLIPTGGGGLLASIGAVVKRRSPKSIVIGVQTDTSPFMHALYHHGSQDGIIEYPSIADGLAGPVDSGSITIPIVRENCDDFILVSEKDTSQAVKFVWQRYQEMIEPSAAVTIAALLSGKITQKPVIAIISGGNIQSELFKKIISESI
jgi:threonine dehydratase